MQTIAILEVVCEDRQRKDFDAATLATLAESIVSKGLFHPIVLRNDNNTLVAGERRLRACTLIHAGGRSFVCDGAPVLPGHIPYNRVGQLTRLELEEAELEENIEREDLSWQERTTTIARLHRLREAQAAERGEVQTFRATATEARSLISRDLPEGESAKPAVGYQATVVRNAVLLQPYLADPEVAKAKSETEALNIVKRKITATFNLELAKRVDTIKSRHVVILGDARTRLSTIGDGTQDVIITDPPYGIGADKMAPMSGSESGTVHEYDDTEAYAVEVAQCIFHEGFRIAKDRAHLYMFCDFALFPRLTMEAILCGWDVWDRPIIWYKPSGGMLGDSTRGPRKSYETILYARKGDRPVTAVYLDVIACNPVDSKRHPAEKPVEVYMNLLRRSATPGNAVIDPCCGVGTIFPAANALGLFATGIELSEQFYAVSKLRLDEK